MPTARAAEPAEPLKPAISEGAAAAVSQMGNTLLAKEFSFTAKTIRVYLDQSGQPLHIFHTLRVVVRRPDRLAVQSTGDDGSHDLFYDGKSVSIFFPDSKEYAVIGAPGDIASALDEVVGKLVIDFPLVDFFSNSPDKSFLSGVTAGWQVGTAKVGGVECRHLFFSQRGGIDLELWVEKNDAAIPHRLIATYRLLPGQPDFIAEFTNWDAAVNPSDAEFTFQPPADATKIELGQAAAPGEPRSN
ncbi:MAG: DUF2092 domain-containing protein [Acetobacteraceae bacterium]|nr:DUF2092 domain-containing protein [Acetobacteraceae bacterium]